MNKMKQSIHSGDNSINNNINQVNIYTESSKASFNLSDDSSRRKFVINCVTEIIEKENFDLISLGQLKSKLSLEIVKNCTLSEYNYSFDDLLPLFNEFLNSKLFKKEDGYKLSL